MGRRKPSRLNREIGLLAREVLEDVISRNVHSDRVVWISRNRVKILAEKIVRQERQRGSFKNKLRGLLYPYGWSPVLNLSVFELDEQNVMKSPPHKGTSRSRRP